MSDSSDVKGGIGSGHIIAALIAAAAASFAVYQVWRKYTAPPPVPQATTQAIADLKQRFGDDTRVEVSPLDLNMVKIEDALTVAPGAFASLDPGRQATLINGLKDPNTRANTIRDFEKSANERWRSEQTYDATITELGQCPGDIAGLTDLCEKATPSERNRLAQIQISYRGERNRLANTRGVELALQSGANDLHQVMAYVEFMHQFVKDEKDRKTREIEASGNTANKRNRVNAHLETFLGANTLNPDTLAAMDASIRGYTDAMQPFSSGAKAIAGLDAANSDPARRDCVKAAGNTLEFSDPVIGGYHVFKHKDILPDQTLPANQLAPAYTDMARAAVTNVASTWEPSVGQTGSVTHVFTDGIPHKAFVPISGATATLASYF